MRKFTHTPVQCKDQIQLCKYAEKFINAKLLLKIANFFPNSAYIFCSLKLKFGQSFKET